MSEYRELLTQLKGDHAPAIVLNGGGCLLCQAQTAIEALMATLAETQAENARMRKDAERWREVDAVIDLTPYLREYHSGVCFSVDAIDAALSQPSTP